jgi:hypothetical protein
VGSAHIALHDKESVIVPACDRSLTFSGKASVSVPPAAEILSDPVDLEVPALGDLVISLFVPGVATSPTIHLTSLHTTYVSTPGHFGLGESTHLLIGISPFLRIVLVPRSKERFFSGPRVRGLYM